jgi:hypothetical protein
VNCSDITECIVSGWRRRLVDDKCLLTAQIALVGPEYQRWVSGLEHSDFMLRFRRFLGSEDLQKLNFQDLTPISWRRLNNAVMRVMET